MTLIQGIVLGIVQALTEFLPVSSSGHLVLAEHFLKIHTPGIAMEVVLHLGTLISILVFYFSELKKLAIDFFTNRDPVGRQMVWGLLIATIPAVIVGLGFEDQIDAFFSNAVLVSVAMIFTGFVLFSTRFIKHKGRDDVLIISALLIGVAQAVAIVPGISRSGMTISVALILGISNITAARFSFILAIPALLGAGILKLNEALQLTTNVSTGAIIGGFLSSAIVGYLVIGLLIRLISKDKFWLFSIYCWTIGLISLLITVA
ncbi:MAG: undecaprenyl-diphosphate phosphatase [FCB group bacterium]|nr:undecaprenyl-diphosphate phosphatase [FCB group bacterium]